MLHRDLASVRKKSNRHLNDPTLETLSFANKVMPPPNIEVRVAPKLVKALAGNTYLKVLELQNSELKATEAPALAESLKVDFL